MKPHSLVFVLAVAACMTAAAQDTLHIRWPLAHYFKYQWPQSYYENVDTFRAQVTFSYPSIYENERAYYMYSKDSLTIHGIAACLISEGDKDGRVSSSYQDASYNDVYDYLCVFEVGNGAITPLRQAKAHMHVTPIAYYIDMDGYGLFSNMDTLPVLPMYECYFSEPITVADSFYIGRKYHAHRPATEQGYLATTMNISHAMTTLPYYSNEVIEQPFATTYYNPQFDSIPQLSYINHGLATQNAQFIFPILNPNRPSDTTAVGSDTTAIGDTLIVSDTLIVGGDTIVFYDTILTVEHPDLLQRVTSVTPNPAAESVKVASGIGMSRVTVFNTSGIRLLDLRVPDGEISTNFDVSRWPSGTYLLRITTPMGTTMKKLTVTR